MNLERLQIEFVKFGANAEATETEGNRLYLDTGNDLRAGVIDHHHLASYTRSTASLVLCHPNLVLNASTSNRQDNGPTIILHENPDLDALCSAYLATHLLNRGEFPQGAESLARYVDLVDAGHSGMSGEKPFTLYAAFYLLAHRLSSRTWPSDREKWRRIVADGFRTVDWVLKSMVRNGNALLDVDAFSCPGLFGPDDRRLVENDFQKYRQKLADPKTKARTLTLHLPSQLGGTVELDALLVRNVQEQGDPNRCLFFKIWARSDCERSPKRQGFNALSVFSDKTAHSPRRCILSVTPGYQASLRELWQKLEEAEGEERRRRFGHDNRWLDPETGAKRTKRKGFDNPDPWYDGRSHDYTILDAPRSGTALSADRIEELFGEFGQGEPKGEDPIWLMRRDRMHKSPRVDDNTLRRLSILAAGARQTGSDRPPVAPTEIFLSYPHARVDWVKQKAYAPLADWLGPEKIFFDEQSIEIGRGWLARIADGVEQARLFVPLYCEEYFRSDLCQWELQLAILRDPLGKERILVPFLVTAEALTLPKYCSLIQTARPPLERFSEELLRVCREVLESE